LAHASTTDLSSAAFAFDQPANGVPRALEGRARRLRVAPPSLAWPRPRPPEATPEQIACRTAQGDHMWDAVLGPLARHGPGR
jgi:hypothetical protein